MNVVVSNTRASWPGGSLHLAEPVKVGDILRIGADRQFCVHVVWVLGDGPCEILVGDPSPYAGLGSIPRHIMAGEPVEVINHIGHQEQR